MTSPYTDRIRRVQDYVRSHSTEDLPLERLARVACFSPHHFHRIFRACTGETVTRFVQRVRLERACTLMMANPKRTLAEIALEAGFSEQSALTRLFKQRYGLAPSRWDRRSRLDDGGIEGYAEALAEARRTGPAPVARVARHPALRLATLRVRAPFREGALPRGYAALTTWLEARGVAWQRAPLVGMSWDNHETTPLDQVCFDLGFAVGPEVRSEGEVTIVALPEVLSVDVRCEGPMSRIAVAWDFLYDSWLPSSGYEPDELPAIKRFVRRPDEVGWERWHVDCTIAIRPLRP